MSLHDYEWVAWLGMIYMLSKVTKGLGSLTDKLHRSAYNVGLDVGNTIYGIDIPSQGVSVADEPLSYPLIVISEDGSFFYTDANTYREVALQEDDIISAFNGAKTLRFKFDDYVPGNLGRKLQSLVDRGYDVVFNTWMMKGNA